MGFFADLFGTATPAPVTIVRNVLGEEIDRIRWCNGEDLRRHVNALGALSEMSLFGAQCDGINLLGARLFRTDFQKASLRGAELAFSYAAGASFVVLICAAVLSIEQKLVWVDGTPLRILRTPWLMRPQTFQSVRFSVSGGCREGHTTDLLSGDRHPCRCPVQAAARP